MERSGDNLSDAFKKFEHHMKLMSGNLKGKPEEEKISYLFLWIRERRREVYNTFTPPACDDSNKLQLYLELLKRMYNLNLTLQIQ